MTYPRQTQGPLIKAVIKFFFEGQKDSQKNQIQCQFNPKEYAISRTNNWTIKPAKEAEIGHPEFGGGQPATLKLQLLFDDYDIADSETGTDLQESTKLLWKAMRLQGSGKTLKPPPNCQFCWGNVWSFKAVITSLSQKFILFSPSGKPLRALVDISFTQIEEEDLYPNQNPTSGGGTGEHVRTVRAGDTLAGIAFEEYGDPTVWRHLADTNKIHNPLRLSPGQVLLITPLPLV